MEPGIFDHTFPRPTLDATLDAVAAHGVRHIQFHMDTAGLAPMPVSVPDSIVHHVRAACRARGLRIVAVDGTWNMIHPDPAVRDAGLAGLRAIAGTCRELDAPIVTLCTGTRDPESMWRRHADNDSPEAWQNLVETLTAALEIADANDVVLAFEPEPANVISSATRGRELLREMGHPRLKVVMDAANIVATDRSRPPETVLDEAFDLLGEHVVVAHGKDLAANGAFCAAGTGIVPWGHCIDLFRAIGFDGPIILHSLTEAEAPGSISFMQDRLARHTGS